MDDINIFKLLEYGVPGFAVVLLFFGYRLLSAFQDRVADVDPQRFTNGQIFDSWSKMVSATMVNARLFMLVSVVFFAGGLAIAIFRPENEIIVSMIPADDIGSVVTLQEAPIEWGEDHRRLIKVQNDNVLRVNNHKVFRSILDLNTEVDELRRKISEIVSQRAEASPEAGF